jgi:hypothetical protein
MSNYASLIARPSNGQDIQGLLTFSGTQDGLNPSIVKSTDRHRAQIQGDHLETDILGGVSRFQVDEALATFTVL